eukprot:jgi/Tetstr1/462168/TSEL_007233.t1
MQNGAAGCCASRGEDLATTSAGDVEPGLSTLRTPALRRLASSSSSIGDEDEGGASTSASDGQRALERLWDTCLKSAAIGFCLRGGLSGVSLLLSQLSRRKRRAKRSRTHLLSLGLDTLKYTAFLAAFGGTYVSVDEGLSYFLGKERSKNWRAAAAGACAAPTLLLIGSSSQSGLAAYIFLRGLLLLVRAGNKPGASEWVRAALAPSRWEHSDTLLMCLASSQLLQSWLALPETLPASYVKFLNVHGGKKPLVYNALREWARRNHGQPAPLRSLASSAKFSGRPIERACQFVHPGASCSGHAVTQLPANFRRALSVYIPVYVIPALLVHRHNVLKQPVDISSKVAKGILRSSLFLAVYVALAWRGACVVHTTRRHVPPQLLSSVTMYGLTVWVAGIATLLEKKSRRLELALYCMSRALVSFTLSLVQRGLIPQRLARLRGDVAVFALGLAAITHCYSDGEGRHRDVFKSKYLSVLDFVFGNSGFAQGSICHVPSSQRMLHLLLRSRGAPGPSGSASRFGPHTRSTGSLRPRPSMDFSSDADAIDTADIDAGADFPSQAEVATPTTPRPESPLQPPRLSGPARLRSMSVGKLVQSWDGGWASWALGSDRP